MSQNLQQVQVAKRQHLAHLPSGRVLEFGNVIDCIPQADEVELYQATPDGIRVVTLEGEDGVAALMFMRGIAFVTLRKEPAIETATVLPPEPSSKKKYN